MICGNIDYAVRPVTYLVVGGGGGGANGGGGGGGVVPWQEFTPERFTSYPAIVGAAGVGGNINGGNSSFNGTVAYGGGGGGLAQYYDGNDGGSGGGSGQPRRGNGSVSAGRGVYPGSGYISAARQGYNGSLGRDNGEYPYRGGSGGGYGGGGGGHGDGTPGGEGYGIDSATQLAAPFSNYGGIVVTTVGSGGGWQGQDNGAGGTGAAGASTVATMFGCAGGGISGAAKPGVVALYYSGPQLFNGGNYITFVPSANRTYHVFTSSGTLTT